MLSYPEHDRCTKKKVSLQYPKVSFFLCFSPEKHESFGLVLINTV